MMQKKLTFLFLFFSISLVFSQVKWMTLEQALEAQKTQPKKILIDFYADWCGPCKTMDKYTFGHQVISDLLNDNYYAVKFNSESSEKVLYLGKSFLNEGYKENKKGRNSVHDFTKFMNVNAIPSIVFLDEKAMPITILQGTMTAKEIEPYLVFFAQDQQKKIKTREDWENYQKKFRSSIKE